MTGVNENELAEFAADADKWFAENTPRDPGFMLPLSFLEVGTDQQFEFLCNWQRKVWEAGYLGAAWPSEYGGGGLDQAFQDAATKAMRRHGGPIMLNAIGINWTGPLLLEMGTDEQKRAYLKNILSAEDIWCQGFSEPDNGSDLGNAQLKAVRDGADYVLNGQKIWTTLGNYAKHMILLARTADDAPSKYAGLSFFLSPMTVPGIETRPIRKITGEFGFTQTFFTDARIPADCLMGEEGQGWLIAMRTLEYERGARGGQAGGYVLTPFDAFSIVDLAKKATRDGKPVLDDPVIRDRLIEFIMEGQALGLCDQRGRIAPLNQDRPAALSLSNKLMWSEFVRRLCEFAITLTGDKAGYYVGDEKAVDDGLWTRAYLNSFGATIGGGTTEIQRNIVAEHVLGLPKG